MAINPFSNAKTPAVKGKVWSQLKSKAFRVSNEEADHLTPFDDRDLPINDLSIERTEEIEKIALPRMEKAFEKFLKENPEFDKRKK